MHGLQAQLHQPAVGDVADIFFYTFSVYTLDTTEFKAKSIKGLAVNNS